MTDRRVTRRRLLAAGGTAALGVAGCAATPRRTVETVVAVPGERVPENLAFGPSGNFANDSPSDGAVFRARL